MDLKQHKHHLAQFLFDCFPLKQVDDSKPRFAAKDMEELIDAYIETAEEEGEEDKQLRYDADEEERQFNKEAGYESD